MFSPELYDTWDDVPAAVRARAKRPWREAPGLDGVLVIPWPDDSPEVVAEGEIKSLLWIKRALARACEAGRSVGRS